MVQNVTDLFMIFHPILTDASRLSQVSWMVFALDVTASFI